MSEQADQPTRAYKSAGPSATLVVDFTRIPEADFDPTKPLLVASMRDGEVIAKQVVTPAEADDPRRVEVRVPLSSVDGVSGAQVVVAPADDERNLHSDKAARRFVSGRGDSIDAGDLFVTPGIYRWWRFCWFPHTYRVTGRVVRHDGNCTHPVGAANVELYDVDYCWWWYDESLVASTATDADGFFDTTFTWCVPLWCLFEQLVAQPPYVDAALRDRLREIVEIHHPVPPVPDGPRAWESWLRSVGVESANAAGRVTGGRAGQRPSAANSARPAVVPLPTATVSPAWNWEELFSPVIFWPFCDDPCDWRPDLRIRVTQDQPGAGSVRIFEETYSQIHWDLAGDLLNLTLEANEHALYSDACRPDPLLGNCMLFERVGSYNVSTIYQPSIAAGASYGKIPDRLARLGRTDESDRAWCLTPGIHGDFGLAAQVDYYQVEMTKWTPADFAAAWGSAGPTNYVPAANWVPVPVQALGGFNRIYSELTYVLGFPFYVWRSEAFGPHQIGAFPGLYKSRRRFEQEYRDAHGGANPAPDFNSGWYWDTNTATRLFDLVTDETLFGGDGVYSFRIVGYHQTGVDASGTPILQTVDMGLPGGVCRRCGGADAPLIPELLTLRVVNDHRKPDCGIIALKKNGVQEILECDFVVLGSTDTLSIEFKASDPNGELDSYGLTLQRGSDAPVELIQDPTLPGLTVTETPTHVPPTPAGPSYAKALAQGTTPGLVPPDPGPAPVWTGSSWTVELPEAFLATLGGSCAYDIEVTASNRQTDGYSVDWSEVSCESRRAFTMILASDRAKFCAELGCPIPTPAA